MSDPGSLQNLNDIVLPPPVPWWPPAPGWFVLAALLLLALLWLGARAWRRGRRNRYRREALRLLARSEEANDPVSTQYVPELLKRAALSAYPRNKVAALSGDDWHRFLDESAGMQRFARGAGHLLDRLAYGRETALSSEELQELYGAAEQWLQRHRAPEPGG